MVDVVFVDFHRNHGFRFFEEPQEPRLPNLKEPKKWSSWSSWIFNETMDVVFFKNHRNHEYQFGLCGLCGSYIIVWFLYLTHHLGESVEVVGTVYEFTAFVVEKEDGYFRDVVFQSVG